MCKEYGGGFAGFMVEHARKLERENAELKRQISLFLEQEKEMKQRHKDDVDLWKTRCMNRHQREMP